MEEKQEGSQIKLLQDLAAKIANQRGIGDLAAAYVAASGEIENVVKNANNPHFGSNYADLSAVLDTIKPPFFRNGLALLQAPGKMDGDKISLTWILMHKSGQHITGESQLPIGSKATAQAAGSAFTYARRYQAAAIGGIAQVDDDGQAASESPKSAPPKKKGPAPDSGTVQKAEELITRIQGYTDPDLLQKEMKSEVAEFGDQAVANAYVEHRRALKEAAKGAK